MNKFILNNIEGIHLIKAKKTVLYWLLGIIYIAFIGLQLGRIQAIADFDYGLHEMMTGPAYFATFTVPILFLIYIYLLIKSYKRCKFNTLTAKSIIKTVLVIISLVIIFWIEGYQAQEVSTTGIYEINQKTQEDSRYYIVLEDKKIRVTRNEYTLINDSGKYLVGYIWNRNSPSKGKLEIIDPITN